MKSLETVLREGNSTVNQQIKGRFIAQHVHTNVNTLVEYILSKGFEDTNAPFSFDDVENMFTYPEFRGSQINFEGGDNEESIKEANEKLEEMEELLDNLDTDQDNEVTNKLKESIADLESDIEELENLESGPQEVLEWWIVSSFLCEKLNELEHPVISYENIWGRCTSGQAILLDYTITKICADMGILEGQESSWA